MNARARFQVAVVQTLDLYLHWMLQYQCPWLHRGGSPHLHTASLQALEPKLSWCNSLIHLTSSRARHCAHQKDSGKKTRRCRRTEADDEVCSRILKYTDTLLDLFAY